MGRRITVCESCLDAVREEPGGAALNAAETDMMARELGADIADHWCEAREDDEPCGCACRIYGDD